MIGIRPNLALESRPTAGLERVPLGVHAASVADAAHAAAVADAAHAAAVADAAHAASRLALPVALVGRGAAQASLAWFALTPATAERAAFVPPSASWSRPSGIGGTATSTSPSAS